MNSLCFAVKRCVSALKNTPDKPSLRHTCRALPVEVCGLAGAAIFRSRFVGGRLRFVWMGRRKLEQKFRVSGKTTGKVQRI